MSKQCEIVQDLLPLYVDRACSEASTEIIKEHLETCADCRAIYEQMCSYTNEEILHKESESVLMRHNAKERRKNRKNITVAIIVSVAICIITIFTVVCLLPIKIDFSFNNIEPYYEGKGLCVKIVDYDGANYSEEPRYNYHEIQKAENVTAPGVFTTVFSITDVKKEYIVLTLKEPLFQNGNKVSEIKLSIGDIIELRTSTEGAGTAYTFSIEDWRYE